ncbi:MAG: glycosyl transferase [Fimbriimonadales bacterium]|nr:MAG: glycosyl transferase [Fimbriimonadales bacterium]
MIVRDEEEWLGPCLDSALALGITRWVVVDTGSTDGTQGLVREKLGHLPGELVEIEWQGFGPARSEALRRARGKADLILMLDADMTVHGELPDPNSADSWLVTVKDPPLEYALPLLVRGDGPWYYKGVVHSYLHRDDRHWREERCNLWVEDRRPGGWRPGKLEEDARLLEAELERNPLDARSSFYLAQTYEDLGRTGDALREYGRRILLGGYDQERFIAKLRRARILCERDPALALGACLDAWQERPQRAEPLYVAARQARRSGMDDVALLFARRAAEIPKPDDRLFVEDAVYAYGIPMELGIAEIRAGDRERGERILRDLRDSQELPKGYRVWIAELLGEQVAA